MESYPIMTQVTQRPGYTANWTIRSAFTQLGLRPFEDDGAAEIARARAGGPLPAELEKRTNKETRYVVLGHLQRGGAPTAFDKTLATRFGGKAVELLMDGQYGNMVANLPPDLVPVPLGDVVGRIKAVPLDSDLMKTGRALGVSFGD